MVKDPRSRNTYFDARDVSTYFHEYLDALRNAAILGISSRNLEDALHAMSATLDSNGRIFVGGNGGSSAISDHLCCDWQKGTFQDGHHNLVVHNLVASQALFSAVANDFGYDKTLTFPLMAARLKREDVVILISSSGNSPNIVQAANFVQKKLATVIGMTGFDGGSLKEMADISLHIPINNYGVVEDCHQILMHVLAQYHFKVHSE